MGETPLVRVSTTMLDADDLRGVLDDVSEVLGAPTVDGYRILLESAEPPFETILRITDIINAIGVTIGVTKFGVGVCRALYQKLSARFPNRRVQILLETEDADGNSVRYPVSPDTTDAAVAKIAYDREREVSGDGRMRFEVDEGWMTWEEYSAAKRKGAV